jgi:hypothetical protein
MCVSVYEDSIRMDLRERRAFVYWIHLDHDRDQWLVVNTVMNLRIP